MSQAPIQSPGPAVAPPTDEPRMGVIIGDRLCTRCHFNLTGQTIVRERHYRLLIARCPECGTPAPLQEYPLLGRWATRLGYLVAALYFLGLIGLLSLAGLAAWGTSESMAERLLAPYQVHVGELWTRRAAENPASVPGSAGWNPATWQADQRWWSGLDKSKVFQDAGGWSGGIAWSGLWTILYMILTLGPLGVLLAVCMPHARCGVRVGVLVIVGLLAAVFSFISLAQWGAVMGMNVWMTVNNGGWGAWRDQAWRVMPISLGCALVCLAAAMWSGRAIARRLIAFLLPPRLRGPLAFLWIVDGRPIPR